MTSCDRRPLKLIGAGGDPTALAAADVDAVDPPKTGGEAAAPTAVVPGDVALKALVDDDDEAVKTGGCKILTSSNGWTS